MIKLEILDGVGKITLDRPEKYHSFVREMALKLQDKLDQCENNDRVRAIFITASGKAFCAGQDLAEAIDPAIPSISTVSYTHLTLPTKRIV